VLNIPRRNKATATQRVGSWELQADSIEPHYVGTLPARVRTRATGNRQQVTEDG
jgi:hypothetical protein